jgi:group II intron reverse transcriptase/maturase
MAPIKKNPKIFTGPKPKEKRAKTIEEKRIRKEKKEKLKKAIIKTMEKPLNILNGIRKRSIAQEKEKKNKGIYINYKKFDDLETLLHKKEIFIQALGNISANKGSMTKGTDQETIDGISMKKLEQTIEKIKQGTFKFKPFRQIMIPKPRKTVKRPLGIPNFTDRLVQASLLLILEAIYDPVFERLEVNFGFRKKRSAHQAMYRIKRTGNSNQIAIEGDIKSAYPTVSHSILMKLLRKRISDEKFLKIIGQGLKCGLLFFGKREDTIIGTPQGGIVSPMLFNIYMHEFDEYITGELSDYIKEYNEKNGRIKVPRFFEWVSYDGKMQRNRKKYFEEKQEKKYIDQTAESRLILKGILKKIKDTNKLRLSVPCVDVPKSLIRISYTRYADDWIITTNCKKEFAEELKQKITLWLRTHLEFELDPIKTKITNLKAKKATFLGFAIYAYRFRRLSKGKYGDVIKSAGWEMRITVDMDRVLKRLHDNKFCNEYKNYFPTYNGPLTELREEEIVNKYNAVIRGLANYLIPVTDIKKPITRICYILKFSCTHTFANKFKTKTTKILKRFGNPLTININEKATRKGKEGEIIEIKKASKQVKLLDYLECVKLTKDKRDNFKKGIIDEDINSDVFYENY